VRLLREVLHPSTTRKAFHMLALTLTMISLVSSSFGAPVELLVNGNFKKGSEGWRTEGAAFLDGESIKIVREGSLSQIVQRPDLSFYLELSYSVRTELPSKAYFARSLVTFYVIDRQSKNSYFTIIGEIYDELGNSNWKDVKLDLLKLFRKDAGDPENFQLTALKIAVELGFTASVPPPAVSCFRNFSLKRVNPVRILLHEGRWRELPDRTELVVSVTNVGDLNASNLVVMLMSSQEIVVISGGAVSNRGTLEGGSSWQLSWMLAARSSGVHPVTIRVVCDQTSAELSVSVPVPGIPQITTTRTSTMTVERTAENVIVLFVQAAFIAMLAFLILVVVIPIVRRRGGSEVVYRLRLLRDQLTHAAFDRTIQQ